MSGQAVAPPVTRIMFAAPSALNTDTFMNDFDTNKNFYNLKKNNRILDIVNETDPIAGLLYLLKLERDGRMSRQWFSNRLSTTFQNTVRPGFPYDIAVGEVQFIEQQLSGALAAQNYNVTWLLTF